MKNERAMMTAGLLAILTGLASVSCNKGLQTYSGEAGIYFAMRIPDHSANPDTMYSETTTLPFVTTAKDDSLLSVRVKIVGHVSDRDRSFRIETVEEGTDVLPEDCRRPDGDYVVKAGEVYGQVPVLFHRSPSLSGQERRLKIRLVANEEFSLPITRWKNSSKEFADVTEHTIIVSDKYVQLPGYAEYAFGPFSEKKMKLLLQLSGLELNDFNEPLSHTYAKALGQKLDRYLREQQAKGQPVLEEDGTPMVPGKNIYI